MSDDGTDPRSVLGFLRAQFSEQVDVLETQEIPIDVSSVELTVTDGLLNAMRTHLPKCVCETCPSDESSYLIECSSIFVRRVQPSDCEVLRLLRHELCHIADYQRRGLTSDSHPQFQKMLEKTDAVVGTSDYDTGLHKLVCDVCGETAETFDGWTRHLRMQEKRQLNGIWTLCLNAPCSGRLELHFDVGDASVLPQKNATV